MSSTPRKRFSHRLKEPFGKAGLTVAICALVMALVGGAYAAGGLTKAQEKQVTKIAKKYAGKPGATGAAGTAGTNGTNGKDGTNGTDGKDGVSVTSNEFEGGVEPLTEPCVQQGGSEFHSASGTTYACNGKEGSPWTAGGTLPSGKTETGTWAARPSATGSLYEPFSFPIPLAEPLEYHSKKAEEEGEGTNQVHFINSFTGKQISNGEGPEEEQTACPGTTAEPTAEPGNLCVYRQFALNLKFIAIGNAALSGSAGVGTTGGLISFEATALPALGLGAWAVTAE